MNVKPGDHARVVDTGTVNDGAIVRVARFDGYLAFSCGEPMWEVEGENLLGFEIGPLMIPKGVVSCAIAPDRCLRRIDDGAPEIDMREPVELADPVADTENQCLTT